MQLFAKFKKILRRGFRATLNFRKDGEIGSKSREEGEIGSESREKGDLPPCSPLSFMYAYRVRRDCLNPAVLCYTLGR